MKSLLRSRRSKLLVVIALLLAVIVTFPLSLAFRLIGLESMGVAARSLRGPVWWGGAEELTVGGIRLGTVDVFLDPLRLVIGTARVDIARINGRPDDLVGGVELGMGLRGLANVTGTVPVGDRLAPIPVSRVEFDHVSVRFNGVRCTQAEGRVRFHLPALIGATGLANTLIATAQCDGDAVLLPLASPSGRERLALRVKADGHYEAAMRVRNDASLQAAALMAGGFRADGGDLVLRITGTL